MNSPSPLTADSGQHSLSLAGAWQCRLDPEGIGASQGWAVQELDQSVELPGSLDQAGLGDPNLNRDWMGGLSRKVRFTGCAWFSKSVEVPSGPPSASVVLLIERSHWFVQPWVNGVALEERDSLSVHQEWDLTPWAGQQVKLALRVDNTPRIPIGRICHAITDWTQTNWNGVIGRLELQVRLQNSPKFKSVSSVPDGLKVAASSAPGAELKLTSPDLPGFALESACDEEGQCSFLLERSLLPEWSDEDPKLLRLVLASGGQETEITTGCRLMQAEGAKLHLNGLPIFLRGTLDACVFPLTGFPPTEVDPWLTIFRKAKEYGLNHIRFHSWCPPEAAFAAADRCGIIIQAELPLWTGKWPLSSSPALLDFCRREAYRILNAYGSHPSFCLFTLGNEMAFYGEEPEVERLLLDLKADFPHILFNFSSHGTYLSSNCDYYVQADNGRQGAENLPLRGSTWFGVGSRFDREAPSTTTVCDEAASQFDRPVISHEVGEWAVFPRLAETEKYKGVLEPRNLEVVRSQLASNGMEDQAEEFTQASGRLSALLYKEEMETLLRTKGLAGVQLLGLNDFPGQGTATIGMLDSFWEEKGFITGPEFRQFCSDSVPLMEAEKLVWRNDEEFRARLSCFSRGRRGKSKLHCQVKRSSGEVVFADDLLFESLGHCQADHAGSFVLPLQSFAGAEKLVLEASVEGGGQNQWSFWVFPASQPEVLLPNLEVFAWYREDVRTALKDGKTVWLKIHPDRTWTGIPGRFASAFWSPIHFKEQVGTMGTLIQKESPLLEGFPTEDHTEWHWWEILTKSKAMVLNSLPPEFRPTLQVIDRYERNWKLGTIFEARVGAGRLLVTNIDFETPNRPAAAHLETSLRRHLASGQFNPKQEITLAELDGVFSEEP